MPTSQLRRLAAITATLFIAFAGIASAATTSERSPTTQAPASSTPLAKGKTAGMWGTIDTGDLELDKRCEAEADFLNQPAMQTPAGGNTMGDLKELATGIANEANQNGCKLFPM